MTGLLTERIERGLQRGVDPAITQFARLLGEEAGALGVLFYGSNLRTGSLDGVLDFYVLLPGAQIERIWPRISYREWEHGGATLRAKIATMSLEKFAWACAGQSRDTTIWARFVQPGALVWQDNRQSGQAIADAVAAAAQTAARLATALGPEQGPAEAYWRALFRATYQAEFRVEKPGREEAILSVNADHFAGLLPLALGAAEIRYDQAGTVLTPHMSSEERARVLRWWNRRRRMGKPLNIARLVKATTTFDGAGKYAAWKVERHTGVPVQLTPFKERHPILAAPSVLFDVWRKRR